MLGGVIDDQLFTTEGIQRYAELPNLSVQQLILSRTLTLLQSSLQNNLVYNQQRLCHQIEHLSKQT